MNKLEIDEIIALVIVLGSIVLLCLGINSELKSILALSAGWAFGGRFYYRYRTRDRR